MKTIEKLFAWISLLILIAGIVTKAILGAKDLGVFITLAFVGVMMWVIFFVASTFPADLRMTQKQRSKISDMVKYQEKYRRVLLGVDFGFSIVFSVLLFLIA